MSVCIEDNGNIVSIGCKNNFAGNVHIAAIEGTEVIIGDDCLFSSDVTFRTGDSHSIISNTLGDNYRRLNPSENIKIGNHVWFGNSTKILKGVSIRGNTIIGTGSIVTKSIEQEYVIVAGNPAKIVKSGVNWLSKRI